VNDTQTTLFNGDSDWDWVEPRSPRAGQSDWYLFAHGHDYRGAMKDYTKVAGGIPLPPRSTFGIFFSRYWGKHSIIDCYAVIYIL
jgi:alpha-glucosidase (family GH31 glycosyl hydrolase)